MRPGTRAYPSTGALSAGSAAAGRSNGADAAARPIVAAGAAEPSSPNARVGEVPSSVAGRPR